MLWSAAHSLQLELFGFQHKQPLLLDKLVTKMANFTVDQGRFTVNKDEVSNFAVILPVN